LHNIYFKGKLILWQFTTKTISDALSLLLFKDYGYT